jgi:hypothetical protein
VSGWFLGLRGHTTIMVGALGGVVPNGLDGRVNHGFRNGHIIVQDVALMDDLRGNGRW